MQFYLDESGDLGWSLDKPYRSGGSSRFLTIATLCVDASICHLPRRLIKNLYQEYNWKPSKEKKWADMKPRAREWFAREAAKLVATREGLISYSSITVYKPRVQAHMRADGNKLYNYMIKLSLLDEMAKHPVAEFFPDNRSMKIASGNSLSDYLQTVLWYESGAKTELVTQVCDSSQERNVQFADMLSGAVQNHYEDNKSDAWNLLEPAIEHKKLFFY